MNAKGEYSPGVETCSMVHLKFVVAQYLTQLVHHRWWKNGRRGGILFCRATARWVIPRDAGDTVKQMVPIQSSGMRLFQQNKFCWWISSTTPISAKVSEITEMKAAFLFLFSQYLDPKSICWVRNIGLEIGGYVFKMSIT